MTTIDHRILIAAPQHVVWNYVSNLANNPNWQVDCKTVSFLTTNHSGAGTRYRHLTERGREYVVEVTAWYNQLGYEYTFVDGVSYASNKGRLRLQDAPEGTIVQWSFTYELSGMLSGLRNALGTKRAVDNVMVDSLWTLWRHIGQLSANIPPAESKALMRDAPDVEARAHYVSRRSDISDSRPMPSVFDEVPVITSEPPIEDDDTRPRPVTETPLTHVDKPTVSSPEDLVKEPDFLAGIRDEDSQTTLPPVVPPSIDFVPPINLDDTSPKPAIRVADDVSSQPEMPIPSAKHEIVDQDIPHDIPSVEIEEEPSVHFVGDVATSEPPIDKNDTATVSVFDLFGVPKPSETQQMKAINIEVDSTSEVSAQVGVVPTLDASSLDTSLEASASISDEAIEVVLKRVGKRVLMRRKLVNLRSPR